MAHEGATRVKRLLEEEAAWGVDRFDWYKGFGEKVEQTKRGIGFGFTKVKNGGQEDCRLWGVCKKAPLC